MGRITDGSYNFYGKGKDQIDIAAQNRIANPNGSHSFGGLLVSQLLPQLICGGANMLANSQSQSTNASADTTESAAISVSPLDSPEGKAVSDAFKKLKNNKDSSKQAGLEQELDTALQTYYNKYGKDGGVAVRAYIKPLGKTESNYV